MLEGGLLLGQVHEASSDQPALGLIPSPLNTILRFSKRKNRFIKCKVQILSVCEKNKLLVRNQQS